MNTFSRTLTTCVTSAALLMGTVGLAQAYDPNAPATDVAEIIAAVAPDAGDVLEAANTGDAFTARADETTVIIPEDASAPVAITSTNPEATDLTVNLPELTGADDVRQAADGTLVYTSDDDASLAVQPLADGSTRFLSILENTNATERYDYTFDGLTLELLDDGSVIVLDGEAPAGFIAAPWATDANGASVPTHYEVNGSTLTQVVEHANGNFAYPITADPSLSFGWRIYWTLSNKEMRYLVAAGATAGGAVLCSATSGLACFVASAAAGLAIQWINERGDICRAPKPRLQIGIPDGWPQQPFPGLSFACVK